MYAGKQARRAGKERELAAHHVKEVTPLHALCLQVAVICKFHHAVGVLIVAVCDEQQQLALQISKNIRE